MKIQFYPVRLKHEEVALLVPLLASFASFITVEATVLMITGRSLYSATGVSVTSGSVSGTILQTGETNSTIISGKYWSLALRSLTAFEGGKRVTVGLYINDTSGKSGYYIIEVGPGDIGQPSRTCRNQIFKFEGTTINPLAGIVPNSGTVTVDVTEVGFTNTTNYSGGVWQIYATPCLVPGRTYDFLVKIRDSTGNTGSITLRHMAK